MIMRIIVAVDKEWGIGRENDLLFSIPEDMKFFRQTTMGKVIVLGRKTLESFPNGKPLKNRTNIILSRGADREDCIVVNSIDALMRVLSGFSDEEVYVCGGASVYKTLLPYCKEALVTKVDAIGNATAFFPNLDEIDGWNVVETSAPIETNGYTITFNKYVNNNI